MTPAHATDWRFKIYRQSVTGSRQVVWFSGIEPTLSEAMARVANLVQALADPATVVQIVITQL